MTKRIVARIKGGLGNQLFCYAAARRLAVVNDAELVLDDQSGFTNDRYKRAYNLSHFNIHGRLALPSERFEPFSRIRRALVRKISAVQPFEKRTYLEQEGLNFDARLLTRKVNGTVYVDGYWQSENYFKDIEHIIRNDLKISHPADRQNLEMAERIHDTNSVALHLRWFDKPGFELLNNVSANYYRKAISLIENRMEDIHYFIFSDDPQAAVKSLPFLEGRSTLVCHNNTDNMAYADMWLMSNCRHFITANSTFSWWAAWLQNRQDKIVITPQHTAGGVVTSWNFEGLIPGSWIKI